MQEYVLKVSSEQAGERLDRFLVDYFGRQELGFSRTYIQGLITSGNVEKSGSKVIKPHYRLKTDDEIRVIVEEKKHRELVAQEIPLDVVYEDDDLVIINKDAGIVVHPAPGNYEHTLVNALLGRFKNLSDVNPQRPGIVHRLDKETSGLLLIAKNNFTHLSLSKQFAEHSVKRKYIAIVKGKVEFEENIIELPIGRHPVKRKNMSVGFGAGTKYAKTHYRTLIRKPDFSLLELTPYTGRTHQLRVHLAFLGHPILGDSKYGRRDDFGRLALHALSIGFMHPRTQRFVEFSSDIPKEFLCFIKKQENKT